MALGATVKVKMDTSAVSRGLSRIRAGLGRLKSAGARVGSVLRASALPIAGAFAGVGLAIKQTLGFGADLNREMHRTGLSAREVLKLREAFKITTGDADKAADAITEMQEKLQDARKGGGTGMEALDKLGLRLNDLLNMDTITQFTTIIEAINRLPQSERGFTLDKMFGGAGLEMQGLASNFHEEMKQAERTTERLAETVERHGVKSAAGVERAFSTIGAEFNRFFFDILSRFPLDKLTNLLRSIDTTKFSAAIGGTIAFLWEKIEQFFQNPKQVLQEFGNWILGLFKKAGAAMAEGVKSMLGPTASRWIFGKEKTPAPSEGSGGSGGVRFNRPLWDRIKGGLFDGLKSLGNPLNLIPGTQGAQQGIEILLRETQAQNVELKQSNALLRDIAKNKVAYA